MSERSRRALLVGASGLVGGRLLQRLLAEPIYERVTIWVRQALPASDPKLDQVVVDFERLSSQSDKAQAHDVYCCLGTTMRQAGSQQAFYRVDFNYPFQVAFLAQQHGAQRFLMVSALGANARSRVFYNRVKGEAEDAIRELGIAQTWFFRPSLLAGDRAESRPGERFGLAFGKVFGPFMVGDWAKYRPIAAADVAAAMVYAAANDIEPGIVESDKIARLASRSRE